MKFVRSDVYESNSSSCHSISVADTNVYDGITPDADGMITVSPIEFGEDNTVYNDVNAKLAYVLTDIRIWNDDDSFTYNSHKLEMINRVVREHTGAIAVQMVPDPHIPSTWGSIDHQSRGKSDELFASDQMLKAFLFSPKSSITAADDYYGEHDCEWENSFISDRFGDD